jgi:hypothetical protein
LEPEDCLSTESLLKPSLIICKAANTWLDSGKELYVEDLEGEGIAEIKSLLLQLDKALGASQVLVSGALANLTLFKRSEILDKASKDNVLPKQVPVTNYEVNSLTLTK